MSRYLIWFIKSQPTFTVRNKVLFLLQTIYLLGEDKMWDMYMQMPAGGLVTQEE